MKIALRADAYLEIGTGDLVSLWHLALAARTRGHDTLFLARDHEVARSLLALWGAPACWLEGGASIADEQAWMEARCREQAVDALVMEITAHPYDRFSWRQPPAPVLVLVDLFATATPGADVLVNWDVAAVDRYPVARFGGTTLLLGPRFVFLSPEFAEGAGVNREIPARARRLLIACGGGDPMNSTGAVLDLLGSVPGPLEIRVVAGAANPNRAALEAQAAASPHEVAVLGPQATLLPLMRDSDLAVTAGGLTASELLAAGVPTAIITNYEHQAARAAYFHERGAAWLLGAHDEWRARGGAAQLAAMLDDAPRRRAMARAGRALVGDGGVGALLQVLERKVAELRR